MNSTVAVSVLKKALFIVAVIAVVNTIARRVPVVGPIVGRVQQGF